MHFPVLQLKGNDDKHVKQKYLYFEFYEERGKQEIVSEDWKYVKLNVRQGKKSKKTVAELYNFKTDVSEMNNLSVSHPNIILKMENHLKEAYTPIVFTLLFNVQNIKYLCRVNNFFE